MSSVDREVTPWVIFGGHRAMYVNSGYGGNKSSSTYLVFSAECSILMHGHAIS